LERAKRFSRQGLVRNPSEFKIKDQGIWHQEVHEFGLNYRLPDILCALGISQLNRLEDVKAKKKVIFERYVQELSGIEDINLPSESSDVSVNWHLFPVRFDPLKREAIFSSLRKVGIGVQVNYMPAYWHPVFKEAGFREGMFPNSDKFFSQEISLPMYSHLTEDELDFVLKNVLALI
jgi:dTDP-4-amino-4,6-dideoxygalactose transaminase